MASTTLTLTIKDDGTATIDKVVGSLKRMHDEGASGAASLGQAWEKVKGTLGLLGIGTGIGALISYTKDAIDHALKAEQAMNQLAFAVNAATNNAFPAYQSTVMAAVGATSQYAIVTEHAAVNALQLLITNTGKVKESQDNLNLVFDLATAKHMDVASAARIVSLAMEGNVTALRKQLLEFTELNEQLEKHAIRSDRAAIALAFLHDKLDGSSRAVGAHTLKHKELEKAQDEISKWWGGVGLSTMDSFIQRGKNLAGTLLYMTGNTEAARLAWNDAAKMMFYAGEAATTAAVAISNNADVVKRGTAVLDAMTEIEKKHADTEYKERLATDIGTAAINAKTAAIEKLKQAMAVLDELQQQADKAALLVGSPDDAIRRIKQAAFEGAAGTSDAGLKSLIDTTQGLTGADEEDKARLLRDLTEQRRLRAVSQKNRAIEQGGLLTPAQQTALERSGGQSTGQGPYGLVQPTISQPQITVNVNGSLAEAGALAQLIRDSIVPELRQIGVAGGGF